MDDQVTGRGQHLIVVRWHLAPGSTVRMTPGGAVVITSIGQFQVSISGNGPITLVNKRVPIATGFGRTVEVPVLICSMNSVLPVQINTRWRRA